LKANKKDDLECTYSTISKHLKSLFMETTRSPYQPIPLEYEITDLKKKTGKVVNNLGKHLKSRLLVFLQQI